MTNKKAIILGSGFSRAIISDMPLTNGLTDKISEKIEKLPKKTDNDINIIKALWEKHVVAKNIGGLKDFEKILSYLEDAPWKDNITKYEHLILYETLTGLISDILSDITKDEDFFYDLLTKKKVWLKNFIKKIRDEKIPIITFNYDTILEWLLIVYERIESRFDDCEDKNKWGKDYAAKNGGNGPLDYTILIGDEYRANYFCDTYAIKTESFYLNIPNGKDLKYHVNGLLKNPRIFKLHGSLNWLYSNKKDSIIVDDREFLRKRFFKSEVFENMGRTVKLVEDIESDFKILKKGFQTLIIPPIQNKTTTYMKNDYIGQQWLEVREILSQVEELDIVGYSIPATDISTNLMLQDAVNRKDCKINICYFEKEKKLEESLKERFQEAFSLCDLQEKNFHNSGFDENFCKKYI